ncbi:DNA polymerase epsilon subunit D [Sphaceloma murrayae]|uniref:DNA polymerase epsilon subunit D n=1 Tax=Sphaceloma murrayae TaxID=2082308 RepID=A0A2K1QZR0_9PEZI|nr:DNA polymerase epsilon subunit D [Sphaceloma murrayae]
MAVDELDDYWQKGRFKDGLNRCDRMLKKANADLIVHVYRARFLEALGRTDDATAVIKSLADRKPALKDVVVIDDIDDFLFHRASEASSVTVLSSGELSLTLWKNATEATTKSFIPRICQDRYEYAVRQGRLIDAHHALTQWKKAEPNRKDIRFAHAAIFHLISIRSEDEMGKRMYSQLAVRTAEQLARSCTSEPDLVLILEILSQHAKYVKIAELIKDETFASQVEMTNRTRVLVLHSMESAGDWQVVLESTTAALLHSTTEPSEGPQPLIGDEGSFRTWKAWTMAHSKLNTTEDEWHAQLQTLPANSRYRLLASMWLFRSRDLHSTVVNDAIKYFVAFGWSPFCVSELREFLLSAPKVERDNFRKSIASCVQQWAESGEISTGQQLGKILSYEENVLRLECLLDIGGTNTPQLAAIYKYARNALLLRRTCERNAPTADDTWLLTIITALFKAHELEPSGRHLLLAVCMLRRFSNRTSYMYKVLTCYFNHELGVPALAIGAFTSLGVKEMQLETFSHAGLTRISIQSPIPSKDRSTATRDPFDMLNHALKMYEPTSERIAEQQASLLDAGRPDLLLELDKLRHDLQTSLQRRILLLELRRVERLTDRSPQSHHTIQPRTSGSWLRNLSDNRDFSTCEDYDIGPSTASLEHRIMSGNKVPHSAWIRLHLWIDEINSLITNGPSLLAPTHHYHLPPPPVDAALSAESTPAEVVLIPAWEALSTAAVMCFLPPAMHPDASPKSPLAAIEILEERLETLPFSPPATKKDLPTLPSVASLQTSLLTMDFLKVVHRFCVACGEVTKKKRPGTPVDMKAIKALDEQGRRQFERVTEYAVGMQKGIRDGEIKRVVEEGWKLICRGGNDGVGKKEKASEEGTEIEEKVAILEDWTDGSWMVEAEVVSKAARAAWDGILAVRYHA